MIKMVYEDYELANPSAASLMQSLRAFGYDISTAVADLIDNSITAQATQVSIEFEWNNGTPWVSIADNGYGEAMLNGTVYAIVSNCISLITGSKVAGAVVGNAASSYASLPFTDDNGDASQGWCAAAGCATTAGGLAGGLYAYAAAATTATAVTGGAAAPVALAVLLGAAIGYFTIGSAKEYADIVSSPEYQESLEHYWDNVPPDSWLQGF